MARYIIFQQPKGGDPMSSGILRTAMSWSLLSGSDQPLSFIWRISRSRTGRQAPSAAHVSRRPPFRRPLCFWGDCRRAAVVVRPALLPFQRSAAALDEDRRPVSHSSDDRRAFARFTLW